MTDEQKLEIYLERLRVLALEKIQEKKQDAISALKRVPSYS